MKKLILLTGLCTLLFSCHQKRTYYEALNSDQQALLSTPAKNDFVIFNSNGMLDSLIANTVQTYYQYNDPGRGGMFSSPDIYYTQSGSLVYKPTKNSALKITLSARSENPRGTSAYQTIEISKADSTTSYYSINFSNKIPTRTINGRIYHEIVVAVNGKDSLFWRKDLGILGWKKNTDSYVTYRVF